MTRLDVELACSVKGEQCTGLDGLPSLSMPQERKGAEVDFPFFFLFFFLNSPRVRVMSCDKGVIGSSFASLIGYFESSYPNQQG
jgi:hypothetical protein